MFNIFIYNILKLRGRHYWSAVVMAAGRRFSCFPVFQDVWKTRKLESGIGRRIGTGTGTGRGTVMERGTYIKTGTTFILL